MSQRQVLIVASAEVTNALVDYAIDLSDGAARIVSHLPLQPDPKKYSFTQFFALGSKLANTSWTLENIRTKLLPNLPEEERADVEAFLEDPTLGSYMPIQNGSSYLVRVDL